MKSKFTSILIILFAFTLSSQQENKTDLFEYKSIVQEILKLYPASQLIDIYKYFFQSRFGPGHSISDSLMAFIMLREELKSEEIKPYRQIPDSQLVILLKPERKYIRVDLSLLKDRIIPLNLFFSAFYQSASRVDSIDLEQWKNDWNELFKLIERENFKIKNFYEDQIKIKSAFKNNKFVFSHSSEYKRAYKPHYRVIEYKIFENFLLPYLKQYKIKVNKD